MSGCGSTPGASPGAAEAATGAEAAGAAGSAEGVESGAQASAEGGSPDCNCSPAVTIGRVIRGNPYVASSASVADGMSDSVPPSKTYEVEVTISNWSAHCAGKQIKLTIAGSGGDNGTATVSPDQLTGNGTFKVTVTGGDQTKPGNGGKLKIHAELDGAMKAESLGFTVCAHPVNYRDTYAADVDEPKRVGVVVQDGWDSDSGTFSDLDEAEDSEVVEYDAPTSPPYSGGGGANNSGYQKANVLTQDSHRIGRPKAGPKATWERRQVCIFKCHRCGVTDKIHPNSGFKIIHDVFFVGAGSWVHHVQKIGAKVTARGYTSDAGVAAVKSPDHTLP